VDSTSRTPAALQWAIRLLGLEAVAAAGLAVLLGYQAVVAETASRADAFAVTGFVLLLAVALAGLAVALARRKPRARAPAIVLQLLAVMSGVLVLTNGLAWWPLVLIAVGVVVSTLLFAPATAAALGEGTRQ
jgi:hypothetical protein